MVAKANAVVRNEAGIHCRPSAHIVKQAASYPGKITVTGPMGGSSDLRSMLSLMMLALTCGTRVHIEVEGPDEESQLAALVDLFEFHYDFPTEE
jgi:phosphotransferase system HPr (HPr) family protein